MAHTTPIRTALISVFHKDGLEEILRLLAADGVQLISTGGTRAFIQGLGYECRDVEELTTYPSIFGGRVKTLHPAVFGGILQRRDNDGDRSQAGQYHIEPIDLVIVDLYPFEETVRSHGSHEEIIEKIDIGGISLIRAAAKNYADVAIVASKAQYGELLDILRSQGAATTLEQRRRLARQAFAVSSAYDSAIFGYFDGQEPQPTALRIVADGVRHLRYGENPHQEGRFYGNLDAVLSQLHGKEISYNNLQDIEAAISLMADFDPSEPTVAVLKHTNACGCAIRPTVLEAWQAALQGDPVSAFGGIIISNAPIDKATAEEIGKIFFEVIIAPEYTPEALEVLEVKKNRIILRLNDSLEALRRQPLVKSALGGYLVQERDGRVEKAPDMRWVTEHQAPERAGDLAFANILVKHSKSNAIVLANDRQLIASGVGQTSRVDALKQAIDKARRIGFELQGAVMASDAFFPFGDCVQLAHEAGIDTVIQPGGSVRDQESIDYCNAHSVAMAMTGTRHFKH